MYLKILMGLAFVGLLAFQAAAGAAIPIESFIHHVSRTASMHTERVREFAIESMRESGEFSPEELSRIRRPDQGGFEPARANEIVKLLQRNAAFRVSTGLEGLRLQTIQSKAVTSFTAMATSGSGKALTNSIILLEVAQLQLEVVNKTVSAMKTAALANGNPASLRDEILTQERALAQVLVETRAAQERLFTALTTHLTEMQIPFDLITIKGRPIIELEIDSAVGAIRGLRKITTNQAGSRTHAGIDVFNIESRSFFSRDTDMMSLGLNALRRIK